MNKTRLTDNTQLTDNLSKFYEDFSKDFRRSSRDHAVELAGLVKIVYLITAIVVIISVYLIYQLLSTRPRHKLRKMKPKSVMLLTSPIILDGHRQVSNIYLDNYLQFILWHSQSTFTKFLGKF